ncbi:ClbS/DfsB family four-helix bundle protein [Pedobacter gandavensis]|uniref:ClbS/DfsB family four-helix bundle protein n=1 Tax=Pedobacter gandavensis TaxID=2679963 RepID=UPI00292D43D4|nr:ClbS/DfsB family four-helix bundle protein [Pedobacter gandavensis]
MIPGNKQELLAELQRSYSLLKSELATINNEIAITKTMDGHAKGTMMSPFDLVSYLLGWGELVLKWYDKTSKELPCDFPETGYKWNELGKLAQKFYIDYEDLEYEVLLKKLDNTVDSILELVGDLEDKALYGVPWYGKWTLGRMIQFNTVSPYRNARARLRKHRKNESVQS